MIYLFSNKHKQGPLRDGANFMQTKNAMLHPGNPNFYLANQQGDKHGLLDDIGSDSQFGEVKCTLKKGEVAIIIGHGGDDNNLYDEDHTKVTDAAVRLMEKIAKDNPEGEYILFLAACGGGIRQPKCQSSLLSSLVQYNQTMAAQLLQNIIQCWGYTASTGLVDLQDGIPNNQKGTHIYGILTDAQEVDQHCGYDCQVTTRLTRMPDGKYITIFFSPPLYKLNNVISWANQGFNPDMQTQFPSLYKTLERTS